MPHIKIVILRQFPLSYPITIRICRSIDYYIAAKHFVNVSYHTTCQCLSVQCLPLFPCTRRLIIPGVYIKASYPLGVHSRLIHYRPTSYSICYCKSHYSSRICLVSTENILLLPSCLYQSTLPAAFILLFLTTRSITRVSHKVFRDWSSTYYFW
jgi:hypothetical protein